MMNEILEFVAGVLITCVLGHFVGLFLDKVVEKPKHPEGLDKEDWEKIYERAPGGKWIGTFERLISLVSFWMGQYTIIGAWLAFKVAAKWEAWKNIVQVPSDLDGVQPRNWYIARNAFGQYIFARFLIGTSVNVLIGALAAYVGSHFVEFIRWCYCK